MNLLVADIGGTNARFAFQADNTQKLSNFSFLKCSDFANIHDAIEFYKNGTSQGSITNRITTNTGFWKPLTWDGSGSLTASWNANFGNGYFGTTAVSSAGTNASGIGIFEYDVPTGYTALSTKGLNL